MGVTTAAIGAAAVGVTALGTAAVNSYADYEQLIGGVETLFKDSANKVSEYANNAYETAGLSANAYMETVTSFTASLLQSLEGDTDAAADAANQAVIDMSDNANKMGTSMESIQNAYQGFAKQNYTMLDNLKLGYGGTKEEMERLLEDAEKITGIKYDISSLNDVYSAIHVIQTELGITGTTALEASTTISGSLNATKSAWSNLVVGIADDNQDFDVLVNNFVESAATAANNLIPRIETTITGIGKLIEELLPVIADEIPVIINDILPDLVESGMNIVNALVRGFVDNFPLLAEAAGDIVDVILEGIGDLCPALEPVTSAIEFLIDNFNELIPIVEGAITIFAGLKAGMAIQSAVQTFQQAQVTLSLFAMQANGASIAQSVLNGTLTAGEAIVALLTGKMTLAELASAGLAKAQVVLNAVMSANPITLIVLGIAALIAIFIVLWNKCDGFRQFWIDLWDNIKTFCLDAVDSIVSFFTETIPALIQNIVDWFMELPERLTEWGENLKETVSTAVSEMIDNVITFFSELPEKIAYWLGYAIGTLIKWKADLINWAVTAIPEFIENIITFFTELPGKIAEWLAKALINIISWGNNMRLKAVEAGSNFVNNIIDYIKTLPSKIADWLTSTITKVLEFKANLIGKAVEAGTGFVSNLIDAVSGLPDKMKEIGANIVSGIWSGISSGWDWLMDKVSNLANSLYQGACDALEVHSPSRKFKWLGEMCVAGFDEGTEDLMNADTLSRNINASMSTVQSNMAGARSTGGVGGFGNFNQTINVNQQISTPDELARAVRLESRYGLMRGVALG